MTGPFRDRCVRALLLLFAAGVFTTGITWGLPSRRVDPFLFGARQPWTGNEILALTESAGEQWDDPSRGADVAAGAVARPLSGRQDRAVCVNDTDARRAQIVRRYRLFTYQPDEMITLMSLARMHPGRGDFDPRLYQYGGLWVYPVGGLLKAASVLHLVQLRSGPEGLAFYLDHPEAFGRFYVVARLYAAAWGLVGVWAVFLIGRRLTGRTGPAALAAILFCLMPVVVNMAHEAKPHLPGAVLALLAVLAAAGYARTGRRRDALATGGACGAAFGMVLSTLPIFSLLPLMTLFRPLSWARRLTVVTAATVAGGGVYAVTNPYVILHLLRDLGRALHGKQFWQHDVFQSNVDNSTAMYHVGHPIAGLLNEVRLVSEGMTAPLALAGAAGAIALGIRAVTVRKGPSEREAVRRATGLLLAIPALLIASQFALIGAGKPDEFGRFMLLPDVFLMIEAAVVLATGWDSRFWRPSNYPPAPGTALKMKLTAMAVTLSAAKGLFCRGRKRSFAALRMTSTYVLGDAPRVSRRLMATPGAGRGEGLLSLGRKTPPASRENWWQFRPRVIVRATAINLSLLSAGWGGGVYLRGFRADSQAMTPRLRDAQVLQFVNVVGDARKLATAADPAPYCLPPVDLFRWTILKLPSGAVTLSDGAFAGSSIPADVFVRPVDHSPDQPVLLSTPISWAAKPFEIAFK